jgi:hypothetical protein
MCESTFPLPFRASLAIPSPEPRNSRLKTIRNKKNIIPSISVTDIVFDNYLGNGIIELFPK